MLRLLTIVFALLGAFASGESNQGYHAAVSEWGIANLVRFNATKTQACQFTAKRSPFFLAPTFKNRHVVQAEGYLSETHNVVTQDGYILEMHRISRDKAPGPPGPRPVVFLMHGLTAGSNSYTYLGPKHSIANNLADAGYDVWMGNARGNRFSRRHTSMDPDKNKLRFFDFTFEEIALNDLPAMFDYILAKTNQAKLHYIGHSQGGTVFLILNSVTTKYHDKIASAHLLAGVGYMTHFPDPVLRLLALSVDTIYNTLRLAGNVEVFPPGSDSIFGRSTPENLLPLNSITGIDTSSELVAGAALKQIAHYGQNIRDRTFRRWDYGPVQNLFRYGRPSPPNYDLSRINIDVTLHYSLADTLLSERDTLAMARAMPKAKARKVARDTFTHVDYVSSEDAKELVTDFIIEALGKP